MLPRIPNALRQRLAPASCADLQKSMVTLSYTSTNLDNVSALLDVDTPKLEAMRNDVVVAVSKYLDEAIRTAMKAEAA